MGRRKLIRRSTNDVFAYLLTSFFFATTVFSSADEVTADSTTQMFFAQEVESILVNRCLECHAEKLEGELDLRTRATALKGSESGVVLVPGEPLKSKLYEMIYNEKMPPKHPLTDSEVDVLKKWIEDGVYFPTEPLVPKVEDQQAAEQWWSLMPLVLRDPPDSEVPEEQPIDRFIRATREFPSTMKASSCIGGNTKRISLLKKYQGFPSRRLIIWAGGSKSFPIM